MAESTGTRGPNGRGLAYYLDHRDDITPACLTWPFGTSHEYGVVWWNGANRLVHVLSCERHHGPRPPGTEALHAPLVCHNSLCFNGAHLFWGTHTENMQHKAWDQTQKRGADHVQAVLTEEQEREVYARAIAGPRGTQQLLAVEFGVAHPTISRIVARQRRKATPPEALA